jgi:hypothetical protein
MIDVNLGIRDYLRLVEYTNKELSKVGNLESIVSLSITEVQKDEILELLGDKLLEIGIRDSMLNSEGLIIERLIDILNS